MLNYLIVFIFLCILSYQHLICRKINKHTCNINFLFHISGVLYEGDEASLIHRIFMISLTVVRCSYLWVFINMRKQYRYIGKWLISATISVEIFYFIYKNNYFILHRLHMTKNIPYHVCYTGNSTVCKTLETCYSCSRSCEPCRVLTVNNTEL